MTGASKTFPPGEAPAAEARAEAALARELAPDDAPLDIALDERAGGAGTSGARRGGDQGILAPCADGPGVYRMIGAEGEVLYVGKARSIKKRIAAYIAPERQPTRIARMVAQTRSMVFVTTESDAEALLLEANLIKQLKPRYNVTLRDDKSFPYILIFTGHPAAAARQASRRAHAARRLFRPLRQRGRGVSHAQRVAAGVSSAHLLRQFLRTIERGPACSTRSSAARRPAPARSRSTITPNWSVKRAISSPAAAARSNNASPPR